VESPQGLGSPDHVYSFTAPSSGNDQFRLEVEGFFSGALYLVSSCGDIDGTCMTAGKTTSQWIPIEVIHDLEAGEQIFAIVDGYDNNMTGWDEEGRYTLTVEEVP
jgi:hypothetical protein